MNVLRTVGEAAGRAEAAIASAVEDFPKVIGSDEVCKESLGRFCDGAGGLACDIFIGIKTAGEVEYSYEDPPILGEVIERLGAPSTSRQNRGLVGVKGNTSIMNSERDDAVNIYARIVPSGYMILAEMNASVRISSPN